MTPSRSVKDLVQQSAASSSAATLAGASRVVSELDKNFSRRTGHYDIGLVAAQASQSQLEAENRSLAASARGLQESLGQAASRTPGIPVVSGSDQLDRLCDDTILQIIISNPATIAALLVSLAPWLLEVGLSATDYTLTAERERQAAPLAVPLPGAHCSLSSQQGSRVASTPW